MGDALRPLEDRGIVAALSLEHVAREDVAELGIGPQQLLARDRRRVGERAGVGDAKERVRHGRVERSAERHVLRIELVDVHAGVVRAAEAEIVPARPDVADGHRLRARQLALEVHRELLHVRRGAVLIHVADVRADARQRAE